MTSQTVRVVDGTIQVWRGPTFDSPLGMFTWEPLGAGRVRLSSTTQDPAASWLAIGDSQYLEGTGSTVELDVSAASWYLQVLSASVMDSDTVTITAEMMSEDYGWQVAHRGPIDVPRSPLVGARRRSGWVIDVLDQNEQLLHTLDGVEAGRLDASIHSAIRSSGTLTVTNPQDTDWHRIRLAIRYEYIDEAGQEHRYPLGVFIPTTPSTKHTEYRAGAEVAIYDKISLLSEDRVATTWSVDAGTSVVAAVSSVLESVAETQIIGPDDGGGTLNAAMVWEPGTTKLRIVNDILAAANFFSIWVDGNGAWRLEPYIPPTARGLSWEHIAGENAIFTADFEHEADGWAVPNVVVLVGRSEDEDTPPPTATARNDAPDDPFSTVGRGRDIVHTEEDQDATSETVLGQIAARRLLELGSVTSTYSITHVWLPTDLNSAQRLVVPDRGIDALCVLQATSWSWNAGQPPSLVAATLREVQQQ